METNELKVLVGRPTNVDRMTDVAIPVATLGENIKALRLARHLDQKVLAERIGTSASALNNWEHGRKVDIPVSTLLKIAKGLRVSVEAVIDGVDLEYVEQRRTDGTPRQRLMELCSLLDDAPARALAPTLEILVFGHPRDGSVPDEEES